MLCRFVRSSVDLWYKVAHYWPPLLNTEKTVKKTGSKHKEVLLKVLEKPNYIKFISYSKVTNRGRSAWLINDGAGKRNGKGENKEA